MKRILESQAVSSILLSIIALLLGITTWFGYTFATNVIQIQQQQEKRIDKIEVDIAVLQKVRFIGP